MITIQQIPSIIQVIRITGNAEGPVNQLCFDSRKIQTGDVFVAIKGTSGNGHDFIGEVIGKGARVIVCEILPSEINEDICYVQTPDTAQALGLLASAWYGNPSAALKLTGITGTNGKTSVATLLFNLFRNLGYGAGLLSTITNRINDREIASTHTTPDPVQINELLAEMVREGCEYCFMEVSSHSVEQQRIAGLEFAGGIFTNLTHDHLDYHGTFNAYLKAKKRFFDHLPPTAFALVNRDDKNGMVMFQNSQAEKYTYSVQAMADFRGKILENSFDGLLLNIDQEEVWFRMIGKFNASNLLAAYATAILLNQKKQDILENLSKSEPVPGRFNYLRNSEKVTAIIDYAHTPDALKNVLETILEIREPNQNVITVVGAGGNRDKTKRPVMASIAAGYSDRLILTSDNPRNEDPLQILEEMKAGLKPRQTHKTLVIENREQAIRTACALAQPCDIILVAGKGHENYQEIKGVKYHFDDREVVENELKKGCKENS